MRRTVPPLLTASAVIVVGVAIIRWRGGSAPPAAERPAAVEAASAEATARSTNEPPEPVARSAQADQAPSSEHGKAASSVQARYEGRGRLSPLRLMNDGLGLSEEQVKKLEPVLKQQQDKLNALRRDTSLSRKDRVAKLREIQQATDASSGRS